LTLTGPWWAVGTRRARASFGPGPTRRAVASWWARRTPVGQRRTGDGGTRLAFSWGGCTGINTSSTTGTGRAAPWRTLRLTFCHPTCLHDGLAPLQFHHTSVFVLLGNFTGGLTVQIDALRRVDQGLDVGRAGGVAVQEDRQRFLVEHTGRPGLDIGLNAQFDRQGVAHAKESRKALGQQGCTSSR
jgi:hypothetical protein